MRSKAIFMALLAFAFQAQAVSVSRTQAASAVNNLVRSGSLFGVRLGAQADAARTRAYTVRQGVQEATFHAVPLKDGSGTVFVSGSTESQAIVCFTKGDLADLPEDSPLYRILAADALFRAQFAQAPSASATASWKALGVNPLTGAAKPIEEDDAPEMISDLRVAPLLTTRWTQPKDKLIVGKVGSTGVVTNLTPNAYYDGCTATAAAQIMKYWRYPESFPLSGDPAADLKAMAFQCSVNPTGRAADAVKTTLMIRANSYDPAAEMEEEVPFVPPYEWDKMQDVPSAANYADYVNHILFDISVALGSDFTPTGTGAAPEKTAKMFKTFGYSTAYVYWDGTTYHSIVGGLHVPALRAKTIYTNLDAGRPVQLAIYGYDKVDGVVDKSTWAGHAVVADGYGFTSAGDTATAYVHVNLGWGGQDDAWYSIPDIDTAVAGAQAGDEGGTYFKFLGGATFNISTNADEVGKSLLTGRLTDSLGQPVAGAVVTATATGKEPVEAVSDANGIYWFALPGGVTYAVRAEGAAANGERIAGRVKKPVALGATQADKDGVVALAKNVGNSWGNDMTMIRPTVRIVRGGAVADEYPNLELALAEVQDDDRVELLEPTTLGVSCFVTSNITVCATNDDPYAATVTRLNGATLSITNGTVTLSNIVFETEATTPVFAFGQGKVKVAGTAVLDDVVSFVPGLVVERAAAFQLVGALENGLTISNAAATAAGDVFGLFGGNSEAASNTASKIVFSGNADLHGEAIVNEDAGGQRQLVWSDDSATLDPAAAVASVTDAEGETTYYRTLDRAFEANPAGGAIVIAKSGARISKPVTLSADYSLAGAAPEVEVVAEEPFGFRVTGGTLTVDGLSFAGATGPGLFVVDGGALAMSDSSIADAVGTNSWSGAVTVLKGTAGLTNVVIRNCLATGKKGLASQTFPAYGGGAYVAADASLWLKDCTIEDCWAVSKGGGVYVEAGAVVGVDGTMRVRNNACGQRNEVQDICLKDRADRVHVTGQLFGDRTVGVRYADVNSDGNHVANEFAVVDADGVSFDACADVFFNDTDADLEAVANGASIVWQVIKVTYGTNKRLPTSLVRVTDGAGNVLYYDRIKYVSGEVTGPVTVEVLGDETYPGDLVFADDVTLKTADDAVGRAKLASTGDGMIVAKGSLTLGDIELDGTVVCDGTIVLADEIDGAVAVAEPSARDTFGEVAPNFFKTDLVAATNCAVKFTREAPVATGMVATNGTGKALLVWSDAFNAKGEIVVNGVTYYGIGDFGGDEPIVVSPDPIGFKSIVRQDGNLWGLVVTNLKRGCNYRLVWTDDLTQGFVYEGEWFQATEDGPWSTNVLFSAPAPTATFWKAEGKEGMIEN